MIEKKFDALLAAVRAEGLLGKGALLAHSRFALTVVWWRAKFADGQVPVANLSRFVRDNFDAGEFARCC